jgi:hypothetical protein
MHRRKLMIILLLVAAPLSAHATVLITPQEAQLPRAQVAPNATAGGAFQGDRGTPTRPPDVLIQSPKGTVASPFPLRLQFTPHNGARIDPNSVTVTLLTRPEVDLTNRVQPYISPRGVDFGQAEAPPGQYRIRIDLTDDAGHTGTATVELQVQHP